MKQSIKLTILFLFFLACGDPTSDVQSDLDQGQNYEAKIVFDAYLIVNQKAEHIFIRRNLPVGSSLSGNQNLASAEVILSDGTDRDTLIFESDSTGFYSNHPSFQSIAAGKTYNLSVSATIDGKMLHAKSSTTTPTGNLNSQLFEPDGTTSLSTIPYYNDDREVTLEFSPSASAAFYVMYFIPEDNRFERLVKDHVLGPFEKEDYDDNKGFKYLSDDIFTLGSVARYKRKVPWRRLFFYSKYELILFAGDQNFKDFYYTFDDVKDLDGNLSEPNFNITGDGIGVFASAISDTLTFTITE